MSGTGLDLKKGGRSAITLAVLAVLFLAGTAWAWSQVTEPFPEKVEAAPCTDTLVSKGDELAPPQVMVSVLNASGSSGLAGNTMDKLVGFGFGEGQTSNAPNGTNTRTAEVWAADPGDPAALLLASYLGRDVKIVDQPSGYPGITIVVGKQFKGVKKGKAKLTAQVDSYVCTPPLSSNPDDIK